MKLFSKNILLAILVLFFIASIWSIFSEQIKSAEEITISELVSAINGGRVREIAVEGEDLKITLRDGGLQQTKKESGVSLPETLKAYGVTEEAMKQIDKFDVRGPSGFLFWIGAILPFLIPIILFSKVVFFISFS